MKHQLVYLEEVADFINGRAFKPSDWSDSGLPIIRIQNLTGTNEGFNYFDGHIDERVRVRKGDILISWSASLGVYRWDGKDAVLNQHIFKVRLNEGIDPDYFFYAATNAVQEMVSRVHGSTMQHITKDRFDSIQIRLPDSSEQQRIAALLNELDRLRRTRSYALELSDRFVAAAFQQLFGPRLKAGPFLEFGDLVKITGGGTPAREHPEFYHGRIPWLTSKDMKSDYIWDTEEHITEKAIQESATNLVPAGSILVVVKSKVLMHRLPVAVAKVPLCHGQDIKSIQCSEALQPEFARFVLKFHEGRLLNLARGANTEGLTLPMLEELPVPTVPISEQEQFTKLVTQHERLRSVQREALRQAEHLFASLLGRAFEGQ